MDLLVLDMNRWERGISGKGKDTLAFPIPAAPRDRLNIYDIGDICTLYYSAGEDPGQVAVPVMIKERHTRLRDSDVCILHDYRDSSCFGMLSLHSYGSVWYLRSGIR